MLSLSHCSRHMCLLLQLDGILYKSGVSQLLSTFLKNDLEISLFWLFFLLTMPNKIQCYICLFFPSLHCFTLFPFILAVSTQGRTKHNFSMYLESYHLSVSIKLYRYLNAERVQGKLCCKVTAKVSCNTCVISIYQQSTILIIQTDKCSLSI